MKAYSKEVKNKCKNCMHYREKNYTCLRYPPITFKRFSPYKKILSLFNGNYIDTLWFEYISFYPNSGTEWWCGEFKEID